MEHERGAFKVIPAISSGAVKKWLGIHEFHCAGIINGVLRMRKYHAGILANWTRMHKK
jgi:hypothetical protein